MKLTTTEKQLLGLLVYPEPFHLILEESGMPYGAVRDDLMNLVSHGYVEVYLSDGSRSISPFYDTDHLEHFAYKATKTGLKAIQGHAV